MTRLDALIILSLTSAVCVLVWCAVVYRIESLAYLGMGLMVIAGAWHEGAEEAINIEQSKRLVHYTWKNHKF